MVSYVWKTAVRLVLTRGLQCIKMSKKSLSDLDKTQAKFILKSSASLHKFCRSNRVLHGMKGHQIERLLDIGYLDLVRSAFRFKLRARSFYLHLLNMYTCTNLSNHSNLRHRVSNTCNKYDMPFVKYVMDVEWKTAEEFPHQRWYR